MIIELNASTTLLSTNEVEKPIAPSQYRGTVDFESVMLTQGNSMDSSDLKAIAANEDYNAALKEVSVQFEALMVRQLIKSMRSASEVLASESPLSQVSGSDFQDYIDQQFSIDMAAKANFGVADKIFQQLSV
ncbi:rod-binding protein [Vibrio breoganii]